MWSCSVFPKKAKDFLAWDASPQLWPWTVLQEFPLAFTNLSVCVQVYYGICGGQRSALGSLFFHLHMVHWMQSPVCSPALPSSVMRGLLSHFWAFFLLPEQAAGLTLAAAAAWYTTVFDRQQPLKRYAHACLPNNHSRTVLQQPDMAKYWYSWVCLSMC